MRIKSFAGIPFGRQNETDDIPLTMQSALMKIPGADGAYDSNADNVYREPVTFSRKFLLSGTAIHTELDTLRAATNQRGWLVFETRGTATRGTWAKLKGVSYSNAPEQINYLPVSLQFEVAWPWLEDESDVWYFDAGLYFDDGLDFGGNYTTQSGSGTFAINNTGGGQITRGLIEIIGTATNPITITNTANGWSITYSSGVGSGNRLLFDIGAQTAVLEAVNVWEYVTLGSNNTGFMRLETGVNTITYTGGGTLIWHWAKVY